MELKKTKWKQRTVRFNGTLLKRLEKLWKADPETDPNDFGYWLRGWIANKLKE